MPDQDTLLSKLNRGSNKQTIASSEASRNINTREFSRYNAPEIEEYKNNYAQEVKRQKQLKDEALRETGLTEEDINKQNLAKSYWDDIINGAKDIVNTTFKLFPPTQSQGEILAPNAPRSNEELTAELVASYNQNKALDRAIKNGKIRNDDFGNIESLDQNLDLMDQDDILDNLKYGLGIEQNRFGDKKLKISFNPDSKYFFYLDKDEQGNDILAKTKIDNYDKLVKTGKTVLNAYGTVPFQKGFLRELGAGLSNTYAGLAKNLVNLNRGLTNLASPLLPDEYVKSTTEKGKRFINEYNVDQSQAGVGGTAEWMGSGIGQGASSLLQMATLGTAGRTLGSFIAPAAEATSKFQALTNFGAGAVLNYNEAYESALQAGLSEDKAASVGLLTGAINGLIESSIGTNRLINSLTGGNTRAIPRAILNELNGEVTEASINRVFNNFQKSLAGDAANTLNRLFESKWLGSAAEEGLEELLQTFSQKGVENLYDIAFAALDKEGQDKFGTKFFSKETLKEGLESAFFGALLGGAGDVTRNIATKLKFRKQDSDDNIIPIIADGRRKEVDAMVKTLHNGGLISDQQKDFYLERVNQLDDLYNKNVGLFTTLDKLEDPVKVEDIKSQALSIINSNFMLNKRNQELETKINEASTDADKLALTKELKNNQLNIQFYNQYLSDNFTANEDGSIPAYQDNYLNQPQIVENKFKRFALNEDNKDLDRLISNSSNKITQLEELLTNPENITDQSPKEVREQLNREQIALSAYERNKARNTADLSNLTQEYNEITSNEYQESLKNAVAESSIEEAEVDSEVTTSAPVEAIPELQVDNNSNVQDNINQAPIVTRASLEEQIQKLNDAINSEELDENTINSLSDQIAVLEDELYELDQNTRQVQLDYDNYVNDSAIKADSLSKLEDNISEPALSAIKKDIEQKIAPFESNGIDTSNLKQLHASISSNLLTIRNRVKQELEETNRLAQEELEASTRNNTTPVSSINYFDRLQRFTNMNTTLSSVYYTDTEVNNIFQNTPLENILNEIEVVYEEGSKFMPVGKTLGVFNDRLSYVNPNMIVSLSYRGKKLGNIQQFDGLSIDNTTLNNYLITNSLDSTLFNATMQELINSLNRNTKINALLKQRGVLTSTDLKAVGFNLNWNGNFKFDTNIPRTSLKSFASAKLTENDNKPYVYDQLRQLEITEGTVDMRDNPLVPAIPKDLIDRYVALVKANNGKFYWIGTQNQVLSEATQNKLYSYLFNNVAKLRNTNPENIKEEVSKINRYLEDNIFVATSDNTLQNTQLQITTPNKTNANYTLALKGTKKRVVLDPSIYATMGDLLEGLGLNRVNLRNAIPDGSNASTIINNLSINLTDQIIDNPYLYKQITFKFDHNKLDDLLVDNTIVDTEPVIEGNTVETDNPFADYEVNEFDVDPSLNIDVEPIQENKPVMVDLSAFDASFNSLPSDVQAQIADEVKDLVQNYDSLNKLQKKGTEAKVRAVINKYKPATGDPVFSIGEASEIIDLPGAVEWIQSNLPSNITVKDVNTLLGNIKNNGMTFGAFSDNIIYLNKAAEVGTEYHEAFHAVYRTLLTDTQIKAANNLATKKFGKATAEQIEALRNSSSLYLYYSNEKLADLWLEEKMADEFKAYANSANKPSTQLSLVWNKILNWFRFITGNMDELQSLFYNINRGKFRNATPKNNIFSQYANQDRVFSVYTKGIDELGNVFTTTQLEGQAIVANLTNKLLNARIDGLFSDLSDDQLLDKFIAEKAKFYSIDENPYYSEYLEERGLLDDDVFIENMSNNLEQKRTIFTLPSNIAAIKKDVVNKYKIFNIDKSIDLEEQQSEIDDIGEQFDRDVWTIGGETSFSTVLREYISLATIKSTDEYGQELDEAVDFSKVYRGLVRALSGVEEDQVLPRFKSIAEFDADINAVYNRFISDLGLTNEGSLDSQNITKNYDLYRKFITAFNNENISWYTVLHSSSQSRLIESNNASAKDIQFNQWLQNYSITDEEIKYNEDLKKAVNKALDAINRSENLSVSSLNEAKIEAEQIKNNFKKVSISLSNAYIVYSLLKNSNYSNLDQQAKDYLNSFSGVEGLYDGGNIPFIVSEFKTGYNPFISTRDENNKERGAVTRIKQIAEQNALFDPTVGESSFQNADGKNVYSILRPSFGLVKLRWLRDNQTRQELLSNDKTKKDDFIDPLENVKLNHLLADENLDIIMKNLTPSMIDGYRQTSIDNDSSLNEEGVTFGKFNAQQYLLADMLMFLSNRKSLNRISETGKTEKLGESAMFNINQMEASNTGYAVFLPVNDFKTINDKALDILFNYFAQEVLRIKKVEREFGKPETKVWIGYNDKPDARGFKLMEFAGYGLEDVVSAVEGNTAEEIYNNLLKVKNNVKESIKNKIQSDINLYKDALEANNIINLLPTVELIRRGFMKEGQVMDEKSVNKLITDYYLNAYINTLSINNLLLDNYSRKVKNTVDWYKRAKGIIGSGPDLGKGFTRVAVYDEPVKYISTKDLSNIDVEKLVANKRQELESEGLLSTDEINTQVGQFEKDLKSSGKIDIADAQSYVTLDHKILQLQRWGRYPKEVSDIYDKIKSGKKITWDEVKKLEKNNAALNSTKTVAYNGDYYFKLSELILAPSLVSKTDQNGDVIMDERGRPAQAKEGFEYLFNKYNAMLDQGVDQALPKSASKMATIKPAKFVEDGKFDFTQSIMEIENKFKRLQVETPSGKSKIIHGTQLIQLVASEQDDNLKIDFKYNDEIKTLGQLRDYYRKLLADNRLSGFKQALNYIKDPISNEFNSKELTKKFYETIVSSGSDEVLSNFFTPDQNGDRQFNWNLGPIVNKAEQLFLAHFSKGVLSQKVPGLKVSLVSDTGIRIKDPKTGKLRELQHMVLDEDGNYYSECLLPPFANELLGQNPSSDKVKEVLKMFGVRIPTQDKHSMMSLKVVGFLPAEYGSVGIFPKQIVYLSGADFDIDSEFIHRPDFYTLRNGILVPFGSAKTDQNKFNEFRKWHLSNNKLLKSRFKAIKADDTVTEDLSTLEGVLDLIANGNEYDVQKAFRSVGLPATLEEFIEQKPINPGANNNAMLEAQIKFLTNNYVRERAATIPASMDSIKAVADIITNRLNTNQSNAVSPNTPIARFNANRSNMEGKTGIGPVALANVTHALLSTNNVELLQKKGLPEIDGKKPTGFAGIYTIDSTEDRKNDNISTLLSAMTDNAKEQLAKALNLTFNGLDTDTLPTAAYMLSIGYTMQDTMLFLNQPSIRLFVTGDKKLNARYNSLLDKVNNDNTFALTTDYLINKLNDNNLTVEDMPTQELILKQFMTLQEQAKYVQAISTLLSTNKGLKSTFDGNINLQNTLTTIGLGGLGYYITDDIETVEQLRSKIANVSFNLPPRAPYDFRNVVINDDNILQNIIIQKRVMDASKEFFLLNTDVFTKLRRIVGTNTKNIIPYFMDKVYRNYLETVYPDKYNKFMEAYNNVGFMVHKSGANSIGRELYNLKKDPDFRNNLLIKLLTLKEPSRGSNIVQIQFPTRIKAEGDFYTNLNNAFKELFMNSKTNNFARKLYYYSYFKDGLQFRNKSFINTIPSWVFKDVSASLDVLNDDFKDNNFDEYTSLKDTVYSNIEDMLSSFTRINSLSQMLQRAAVNNRNIISGKLTGSELTITFKDSSNINVSNLDNYRQSIEKLSKINSNYEEVLQGINYNLASYLTTTVETERGLEEKTITRLLKSLKGFDVNTGEHVTLNLNQVIETYLKGDMPVAYEVIFEQRTPINESGFSSSLTDNTLIDNYINIKKGISTTPTVETSYQAEEILNDTIADNEEKIAEDLQNTENLANFVEENPFSLFSVEDSLAPEEALDVNLEEYQNLIDQSSFDEEFLNNLDSEADTFTDDDNNPIC